MIELTTAIRKKLPAETTLTSSKKMTATCRLFYHVFLVALFFGCAMADDPTAQPENQRHETDAVWLIQNLTTKSDNRVRPGVYGPATEVRIDFFVQSFGPLNEMMMEFAVDLDLRQSWVDPRLAFDTNDKDVPVYIPHHSIDKFWIPDIYFPNEKSGTIHQITLPNKSIRIYHNGTIKYMSRMAMLVSCTMYLAKFPLDKQKCILKISTYSYDVREVNLVWDDTEPIEIHDEELNLPQFELIGKPKARNDCKEAYKTGNFSCLAAVFYLRRKVGFFVLQAFIPSILIVMLSWVGFWINKNSEPARVALGVTTVLTMTTQLTGSASNSMRVSYPKALDVWYSACMVFVFGALLEFAFVNVCTRSEKKLDQPIAQKRPLAEKSADPEKQEDGVEGQDDDAGQLDVVKGLFCGWLSVTKVIRDWHVTAKNIDRMARRIFPLGFLLFNICYWIGYGVIYPDEHAD